MLRRLLPIFAVLVAACSTAPETVTTTTATTTSTPTPSTTSTPTTTTAAPTSFPVTAGVLWDVQSLTELGLPTESHNRSLADLVLVGDRLIATGRDGGRPLILYSDDGGADWQPAHVDTPAGAEASVVGSVAEYNGILVAVGSKGFGCPTPEAMCDDFTSAVWRSTDDGETWSIVDTPTVSLGPESAVVDLVSAQEGFVAIGNINGPAPHSSLLWTSSDGLTWSDGVPLPATTGGFVRAGQLVAGPDFVVVTGDEVLCGDWFDNGFWVIPAGFVEQGRAWTYREGALTPINLADAGIEPPPLPVCPEDGSLLQDSNQYSSRVGVVSPFGGGPAIVAGGVEAAVVAGDRGVTLERLESHDRLDGESVRFVEGSDSVIGIREAERGMLRTRAWADGTLQLEGPPIPTGGNTTISAFAAVDDGVIGVGWVTAGITDGVVWRSGPGSVGEDVALTCDPAPGADCRGVDLRERDLSNRDLSGIDLRQADLTFADLSGANLSGAFFGSAELSAANLGGADLTGAHLAGVDLGSYLDDPLVIAGADFTGADLRGASIDLTESATFDSVVADGAFFNVSGEVTGVTFRNASMVRAFVTAAYDAEVASLVADFSGAHMDLAYFGADMTGSTFAGVAGSDAYFADDAVCPDGSAPTAESYGINRCTWDG